MEMRGDSGGRSKTWTPLTERVGRGIANARRTSSDTALPSAIDRLAAYCRTSRKASSSRERVVLMDTMMSQAQYDVKK